jgi:hypothetical protein
MGTGKGNIWSAFAFHPGRECRFFGLRASPISYSVFLVLLPCYSSGLSMSPTSVLFFRYTRRRSHVNKEKRLRCRKHHHQKRKGTLIPLARETIQEYWESHGMFRSLNIPTRESFTTISYLRFFSHQAFMLICSACLYSSFLLGFAQSVYITTFHGYTPPGFLGLHMGSPRPEFRAVHLALPTSYGILLYLRKCDSVHNTVITEHVRFH